LLVFFACGTLDAMPDTVAAFLHECADLDRLVAPLDEHGWARPTPAAGWTIAHQVAHLAWTDQVCVLSATNPMAFGQVLADAAADPDGYVDRMAEDGAREAPASLLGRWRAGREAVAAALRAAEPGSALAWFGPPMSPRSMATARLMETWAHGQDVADALGVTRTPTDRLRDVCHLGVRTRDFAYRLNGRPVPGVEFRVELDSPSGQVWSWGPVEAADRVAGSAVDFCLVVTQRRLLADTSLRASGEAAHWLTIAQAFAGAPGRAPR
jgi:uncharacterized protein (TIGR03084 family)